MTTPQKTPPPNPFAISKGRKKRPMIGIVFGPPGIGKSHLCSQFSEKTLILDLENGTSELNAARVDTVKTFDQLMQFLGWFFKQDDFDALAIDSISAFERITTKHVVQSQGWTTIEDASYGKGWGMYRGLAERIFGASEHIRDAGKSVIFVGHSVVKTVTDPTQANYDRHEYHIDAKLQPLLTSIVDFCFFMKPQVSTMEDSKKKGDKRTFNSQRRELITVDRGGTLAKNRFSHLPDVIEFENVKGEELDAMYRAFWDQVRGPAKEKIKVEVTETEE